MTHASRRQRRYLERQQSRRIVLAVEVQEDLAAEMLERAEFLPRDQAHCREDLRRALQHAVDLWLGDDASIDG